MPVAPSTRSLKTELSAYRYNPYMYEEPGSNIGRTWDDDYSRNGRRLRPYVGNSYNSYDSDYEMYNGYRSLRPDRKFTHFRPSPMTQRTSSFIFLTFYLLSTLLFITEPGDQGLSRYRNSSYGRYNRGYSGYGYNSGYGMNNYGGGYNSGYGGMGMGMGYNSYGPSYERASYAYSSPIVRADGTLGGYGYDNYGYGGGYGGYGGAYGGGYGYGNRYNTRRYW
eukprot:scaffold6064_cov173-Amphora_coffeaeformis.AAC.8